ncbi:MAG: heat shock protein GrpE [Synergistetes bacterium ADurb.Bin155]|jgi:molecular chaperone GrpE (heat shock protein)|nr:nucleotide exchange factor GrpE [Synergistales bacterium]MBP8995926.1 nucleotide exchange factor GrpE [Synergistales bacterium]OQB46297.1 MAG: heat shock protein GrpE [Synergistetes bacterium ADurb.Bin155]
MIRPEGIRPQENPEDGSRGDGGEGGLEATIEKEPHEEGAVDNEGLLSELGSAKALVERLSEENKALGDAIARARADFFNYRQRVEREQKRLRSMAGEDAAIALIPVLDNLDRALSGNRSDIESYVKGVGMVRDQFFSVLEDLGVSAIETVGKPFDPSIHEAVAVEEAGEEIGDGIITEEVQRGYTISGKVLRAARVKVAKASR